MSTGSRTPRSKSSTKSKSKSIITSPYFSRNGVSDSGGSSSLGGTSTGKGKGKGKGQEKGMSRGKGGKSKGEGQGLGCHGILNGSAGCKSSDWDDEDEVWECECEYEYEYELPVLSLSGGSAFEEGKVRVRVGGEDEGEKEEEEEEEEEEVTLCEGFERRRKRDFDHDEADHESSSSPSLSMLYEKLGSLKPLLIQERVAHDPWKLLVVVTLLNKTTAKVALPVFWEIVSRWGTPWELARADISELKQLLYPLGTYTIRSNRLIEISRAYLKDPPSKYDMRPSRSRVPVKIGCPSPSKTKAKDNKDTRDTVSSSPPSLASDETLETPSSLPGSSSSRSDSESSPTTPPSRSRGRSRVTTRYPPTPISHLPGTGPYALDSYRIFCTTHDDLFSDDWKDVRPSDKELVKFLKWKWTYEEHKEWSPILGVVGPASGVYVQALIEELERDGLAAKESKREE